MTFGVFQSFVVKGLGVCLCLLLTSCQVGKNLDLHPVVSYERPGGEKWGYINKEGELAIPCHFSSASFFNDGRAVVTIHMDNTYRYAIIDTSGAIIRMMDENVATVHPYSNGLARVNVGGEKLYHSDIAGGLWGYIDVEGQWKIPPTISIDPSVGDSQMENVFLQSGGDFREKRAISQNKNGWVFIDKDGNVVSDAYYYASSFVNGVAEVAKKHEDGLRWMYINREGQVIWPSNDKEP